MLLSLSVRRPGLWLASLVSALGASWVASAQAQLSFVNVGHATVTGAGYVNDVAVEGNIAYLSCEPNGLRIYDVSNPASPVFLSGTNNGGSAEGMVLSGNFLFLANYDDGLRVYDASNPKKVINIGHTNNGGLAWNLALSGQDLFLANGSDGLRVYNVADPAHPANIGHASTGGTALSVAVAGHYAYLANSGSGTGGLRIYDISDPTAPVSVGYTNNGNANGVAVYGNYAYVLLNPSGFCIYDVSDPANPSKVNQLTSSDSFPLFHGIAFSGSFACVTMHDGLYLFDITALASPLVAAYVPYSQTYGPSGVTLANNLIYLANQRDGLRIFSLAGPQLGIVATGTNVCLSWPSNFLNFTVQQSPALPGSPWLDLTNSAVLVGGTNQVLLGGPGALGLYRLKLP